MWREAFKDALALRSSARNSTTSAKRGIVDMVPWDGPPEEPCGS